MFLYETLRRSGRTPSQAAPAAPVTEQRVLLAWGEHCVECAAPACYATCDLFDPTPAGKCRRFEGGIQPAPGGGADIVFRRWGKLEAQGNAFLWDSGELRRYESSLRLLGRISNRAGLWLARLTGQDRWATAIEALHKRINGRLQRRDSRELPNMLLVDVENPSPEPAALLLSAQVDRLRLTRTMLPDQLPRQFVTTIAIPPGLSRQEIPVDGMRDIFASGLPFNIALSPEGDRSLRLVFRQLELVARPRVPEASAGSAAKANIPGKCVIFDLDNTLWDGILLEGEVRLRDGIADLFRTLDERGILISIASKNAPEDGLNRLREAGLGDYLLFPQIGWGQKSESIKRIAKTIDIGTDSLIFVDDNPFERDEVAASSPGIEVLPDSAIATLADHPRLQGAVTAESRERRKMYQQAIVREEASASFGDDYIEFLRSCGIVVEIRRDRPEDFDRIAELVQRTNQLNFSGRKYDRAEIAAILSDPARDRHLITVSDRFGSYGMVGFSLSSRAGDTVTIEDFMLSCRVQGKFIEQALFWHLAQRDAPQATRILVNFRQTPRNQAARMVLDKLGFEATPDGGMARDIAPDELAVDFIRFEE